jgi:hypothetical protein
VLVNTLHTQGLTVILEDTKEAEEIQKYVNDDTVDTGEPWPHDKAEGSHSQPRVRIKMIEASSGQIFYIEEPTRIFHMGFEKVSTNKFLPGYISTEGKNNSPMHSIDDVHNCTNHKCSTSTQSLATPYTPTTSQARDLTTAMTAERK